MSKPEDGAGRVVALAGNPNVGKSTVFNALTGLRQHTGNWPGKTVMTARGRVQHNATAYTLVDLPGTYSLLAHSAEEEIARDFICFGGADAVIVLCDATCLERNLNLVLQTLEITGRVVVAVNLMDEAHKKRITVDLQGLSRALHCPVVGCSARSGRGLSQLMDAVARVCESGPAPPGRPVEYPPALEAAASALAALLPAPAGEGPGNRWAALRLLDDDASILAALERHRGRPLYDKGDLEEAAAALRSRYLGGEDAAGRVKDRIVEAIVGRAERIAGETVTCADARYDRRDRRLDRLLTSRATGIPAMVLLLALVFWITLSGANYPSQLLFQGLGWLGERLAGFFAGLGTPDWVGGLLVDGVYKVLSWVVAVMLPPMAIFFPLFTLLEDLGYLPRVAFNLDRYFKKCSACGKQALTMCMGFGCNAAGIVGCRIIDSPRERLLAILTNNFVPCNGRFPMLMALITMFFGFALAEPGQSVVSTLMLTGVIVLGVLMTLAVSRLLSATILKGMPSSFTLELPPYRRPQIGRVIVRSLLDRTLFVLGRAVVIAAPAGLVLWVMANVSVGGASLLARCTAFLDPAGRLFGMDGVILMAFILGFPANEIVVPIMLMAYLMGGSLQKMPDLAALRDLLVQNGWTWVTAVCTLLFSLMHFPCSTACLTIYRETRSLGWTAAAFWLPTLTGLAACLLVASAARLAGLG